MMAGNALRARLTAERPGEGEAVATQLPAAITVLDGDQVIQLKA
jgi:hypothetical protein